MNTELAASHMLYCIDVPVNIVFYFDLCMSHEIADINIVY